MSEKNDDAYLNWRPVKAYLRAPLYASIAEQLEADIANGRLLPNSKLPPQRDLAEFLDVSVNTITRAYAVCERKGIVYAMVGSGTFVSPQAVGSAHATGVQKGDFIEMGMIEPFPQLNSIVAKTVQAVVASAELDQLLDYHTPPSHFKHKQAGKKWMASNGHEVPAEEVLITSGTQNSMVVSLTALFRAGDKIAVDPYTYPNFIELAKLLHITLVPVPGDDNGMLPDALDKLCHENAIKGLYLVPSCNNPTTIVITGERRRQLADVTRQHDLILLEDDVHVFLEPERMELPMAVLAPENTVYLSNVSKGVIGGIRVSFLHAPPRYRAALASGIFSINLKTPSLNAEITAEMILSGAAEQIARQKAGLAKGRYQLMKRLFPQFDAPGKLQYLSWWMELPEHLQQLDGTQVEQAALDAGVRVFHSNRFKVGNHGDAPSFIRVATCTVKTDWELLEGAARIKKLFQAAAPHKQEEFFIV